jgi:AraC-like DNA-binding protein
VEVYAADCSARHENLVVLAAQALLEAIIGNDHDSGVDAHIPVPVALREVLQKLTGAGVATVISIARDSGLSEAYLRKLFKKHMGISLGRYLSEVRQNKARSLLGASDESISHIAELCGYKSVYAFSRSFHAINDFTPSVYRERTRKPATRSSVGATPVPR